MDEDLEQEETAIPVLSKAPLLVLISLSYFLGFKQKVPEKLLQRLLAFICQMFIAFHSLLLSDLLY